MYSCPAPGTISPVKLGMTISVWWGRHGIPILSTKDLLMSAVEYPVSRRAWMVVCFSFQWTTIFTIGQLPQSGFSVVLTGTVGSPGACFLR